MTKRVHAWNYGQEFKDLNYGQEFKDLNLKH